MQVERRDQLVPVAQHVLEPVGVGGFQQRWQVEIKERCLFLQPAEQRSPELAGTPAMVAEEDDNRRVQVRFDGLQEGFGLLIQARGCGLWVLGVAAVGVHPEQVQVWATVVALQEFHVELEQVV